MLHFIFFLESYILQFIFELFNQIYFIKIDEGSNFAKDNFFFNVVIISNHVGVVCYGVQLIVSNVELVRGSKVKRVLSPISTCWKNGNQSLWSQE